MEAFSNGYHDFSWMHSFAGVVRGSIVVASMLGIIGSVVAEEDDEE